MASTSNKQQRVIPIYCHGHIINYQYPNGKKVPHKAVMDAYIASGDVYIDYNSMGNRNDACGDCISCSNP